jgi:hypothetical protein
MKQHEKHHGEGTWNPEDDAAGMALYRTAVKRAEKDERWKQFHDASLAAALTEIPPWSTEHVQLFQWCWEWRFDNPASTDYETIRPLVMRVLKGGKP